MCPGHLLEDLIDHPLEGDFGILQLEGYHSLAVDGAANGEGHLVLIWWMLLDLIIFRIGIHEAEEFTICCCVHYLVYAE